MKKTEIIKIVALFTALTTISWASQDIKQENKDVKQMIFEEQRIEGKIRRPQLVLIKAEQRPQFKPMVMQSFGKLDNIMGSLNSEIIEDSPYKEPFQFDDNNKIKNYKP